MKIIWLWFLQVLDTLNINFYGNIQCIYAEIAVDLGTANTLIIHNDKVVVDEPSSGYG